MAIVFVSPKKKQRAFLGMVWGALLLLLLIISVAAFFPEIKNGFTIVPNPQAFLMPDVTINFSSLDTEKVKNLQLFSAPENQVQAGRQDPFKAY